MFETTEQTTTRFKDIEQSILEKELKKNITRGKNFWNYLAKRYEISNTLACALTQPSKNVLRLNGNQKDTLIMEIHNLQGDIKDIERLVPGTKRSYIEKVIDKNSQDVVNNELIEYKKNVEEVDEVKKKDDKRKMWIPNEVIQEARKTDMPLYDFVSFLYESYKEEAVLPTKKVEEKIVEKKVEVIKEVPVQQKQVKLCSILDKIQGMDSYPDMRKLRAAFEIISGVINRTIPYEKVKEEMEVL